VSFFLLDFIGFFLLDLWTSLYWTLQIYFIGLGFFLGSFLLVHGFFLGSSSLVCGFFLDSFLLIYGFFLGFFLLVHRFSLDSSSFGSCYIIVLY
jgi:hypothetical protein